MQLFIHAFLHLVFPLFVALLFFRKEWRTAYLIMLATMLVDLDHLFSTPIYQPDRCSIGSHFLHTYWAIGVYFVLCFCKKPYRFIGLGLLLHMLTDLIDYQVGQYW